MYKNGGVIILAEEDNYYLLSEEANAATYAAVHARFVDPTHIHNTAANRNFLSTFALAFFCENSGKNMICVKCNGNVDSIVVGVVTI